MPSDTYGRSGKLSNIWRMIRDSGDHVTTFVPAIAGIQQAQQATMESLQKSRIYRFMKWWRGT